MNVEHFWTFIGWSVVVVVVLFAIAVVVGVVRLVRWIVLRLSE